MGFFKDTGITSDDDVLEVGGTSLTEVLSKISKPSAITSNPEKEEFENAFPVDDSEEIEEVHAEAKQEIKPEKEEKPKAVPEKTEAPKEKAEAPETKHREKKKEEPKKKKVSSSSDITGLYISEDVTVSGDLQVDGDVTVLGNINGNLKASGNVIVKAKQAKFEIQTDADVLIDTGCIFIGNIECQNAAIKGKSKGNIHTRDMLYVDNNALVVGDINTKMLNVEQKGRIVGGVHLDMEEDINVKEIFGE